MKISQTVCRGVERLSMKLIYELLILIALMILVTGCLDNPYTPITQPVQQPQQPLPAPAPVPSPQLPPHLQTSPNATIKVTQQNSTVIPPLNFSYLNITTIEYNATPYNTTLIIEYSLNQTMTIKCNDTVFHPEVLPATKSNPVTLYYFIVKCSPRTKGILTINDRTETIYIPRPGETWHVKILR